MTHAPAIPAGNVTAIGPRPRSAVLRAALLLSVFLTAGCADSPVLDMLGGGAGLPQPGAPETPIRRATETQGEWPNLASVPPRPSGVRTPAERQSMMDRLAEDRATSEAESLSLSARAPEPVGPVTPARQPRQIPELGGDVPPTAERLPVPDAPPTVTGG
jgi:hypothetical protein